MTFTPSRLRAAIVSAYAQQEREMMFNKIEVKSDEKVFREYLSHLNQRELELELIAAKILGRYPTLLPILEAEIERRK